MPPTNGTHDPEGLRLRVRDEVLDHLDLGEINIRRAAGSARTDSAQAKLQAVNVPLPVAAHCVREGFCSDETDRAETSYPADADGEETGMTIDDLAIFAGEWELVVDIPGAEDVRGHVSFNVMGEVLVQRTTVPVPQAPDSCCVVVVQQDRFTQHYFDSRGVARLYEMTFDGRTWTLERTKPDFTSLDIYQRYIGAFNDDATAITGEWLSASDGRDWQRDFGLTYRRVRED